MAATVTQNLEAAQNTALGTVTVSHSAAGAGSTLILVMGADDYRATSGTGRPESSGYALVTNGAQETFLGFYVWTKLASGGETSVQYTISPSGPSCYEWYEVTGLDQVTPIDIADGSLTQSASSTYTTPSITPSAGERWLFAAMGGSSGTSNFTSLGSWTNSFATLNDTSTTLASGTRDIIGAGALQVTANGSTAYSVDATYSPGAEARTAVIVAFKVATTTPGLAPRPVVVAQAVKRGSTY